MAKESKPKEPKQPSKAQISAYMKRLGRKGGTARAANNSGQLSEWNRKAALARWGKQGGDQ